MTAQSDYRMADLERRMGIAEGKILSLELWRAFQTGAAFVLGIGGALGAKAIAALLMGHP